MSTKPARASAGGPQLVIGITAQDRGGSAPSDPEISETRESRESVSPATKRVTGAFPPDAPIPVTTQIGVPQLVPQLAKAVHAEPTLDKVAEAERLERVREQSLEIVRKSLDLVRERLASDRPAPLAEHAEEKKSAAAEAEAEEETTAAPPTLIDQLKPAEEPEAVEVPAAMAAPVVETPVDAPEPEPVRLDRTLPMAMKAPELTPVEAVVAAPISEVAISETAESLAAQVTDVTPPPPPEDEVSIPPIVTGQTAEAEPVAEKFFSQGDLGTVTDEEDWDDPQNKAKRKALPHVVERRARLAKYVRWAVAGATVVCLAAVGVSVIPRKGSAKPAAVAAHEAPKPAEAKLAAPKPTAETAGTADWGSLNDLLPPPAATAKAPAKAEEPAAAAPAAPAAPVSDKTAEEEKKEARKSLERGKFLLAIEAGERSVALDPTDGEAWLLLGAAYQDKGNMTDARRCYRACVEQGKRGPLNECRKMAR